VPLPAPHTYEIINALHNEFSVRGTHWRSGLGTALQTGRSRDRFLMVSLECFIDIIRTMALGLTQPLTEICTGIFPRSKIGRCHSHVSIVLKSGNLNLLEPSGPVKTCNGIALLVYVYINSIDLMKFAAHMALLFIVFFYILLITYFIIVYIVVCFVCFRLVA
jgi:hypothetical protein